MGAVHITMHAATEGCAAIKEGHGVDLGRADGSMGVATCVGVRDTKGLSHSGDAPLRAGQHYLFS